MAAAGVDRVEHVPQPKQPGKASGHAVAPAQRRHDGERVAMQQHETRRDIEISQRAVVERHEPAHARIFDHHQLGVAIFLGEDGLDPALVVVEALSKASRIESSPVVPATPSLFEHGFVQTHEPFGLPMIFVLQAQHRLLGQRGTQQPQYARHRRGA